MKTDVKKVGWLLCIYMVADVGLWGLLLSNVCHRQLCVDDILSPWWKLVKATSDKSA